MVLRSSNGWPFIVLEPSQVLDTGLHLYLYRRAQPNQLVGYLSDVWDKQFRSPLVGAGSGSFRIHADHPLAAQLTLGDLVRFRLDGSDRFAMKIDQLTETVVKVGDDSARIINVTGSGVLAVLLDAQTFPQVDGNPTRGFPGITPGHLSRVLVDEATARGALPGVTRAYTDTLDSNNVAWAVTLDQTERAGTSLLRIHERIAESAADVWMTPLLELHMANTRGVDRSIQTADTGPVAFRPGDTAVELARKTDTRIVNVLLVETEGGLVERSNGPSVAEHGRREDFLTLGNVSDPTAIDRVAAAYFDVWAQPRIELTLSVSYQDPLPWIRWAEGDWVRVYSPDGSWEKLRVVAITVTEHPDGTLDVIPELSTITEQLEERMRRWLDAMSRGTATGTATRIAEPVAVPTDAAATVTVIASDSVATHTATVPHVSQLVDLDDVSVTPTEGDILYASDAGLWVPVSGSKVDGRVPTVQPNGTIAWEAPPAGSGGSVPAWLGYLAGRMPDETPHALDDFFTDGTLDPAWSTVAVTGTIAATESRDLLSLRASGGAASDYQGIVKSIGSLSPPVTVEIAGQFLGDTAGGAGMLGLCLTDGIAASSNIFGLRAWSSSGSTSTVEGTLTAVDSVSTVLLTRGGNMIASRIYYRVIWRSANTYTVAMSIDGVTWRRFTLGDRAKTMTPTHVGIFLLDWSSSTDAVAAVDYLRVYAADLTP